MPLISMKNVNLALTALLLCGSLNAKESDFAEKVYVDAVKQVAEMQDNRITFSEDVIITQGTIKIKADKVVVIRSGDKGPRGWRAAQGSSRRACPRQPWPWPSGGRRRTPRQPRALPPRAAA